MTVSAAPLFLVGVGGIVGGFIALLRSLMAYERELFVVRVTDVEHSLREMLDAGRISDSPRLRQLLHIATISASTVEMITPLQLMLMAHEFGSGSEATGRLHSPKHDRHLLEREHKLLLGAWARLLIAGSPSGWAWSLVVLPSAAVTAARRHRETKAVVRQQVVERIVEPADVSWLKPISAAHRGERPPVLV